VNIVWLAKNPSLGTSISTRTLSKVPDKINPWLGAGRSCTEGGARRGNERLSWTRDGPSLFSSSLCVKSISIGRELKLQRVSTWARYVAPRWRGRFLTLLGEPLQITRTRKVCREGGFIVSSKEDHEMCQRRPICMVEEECASRLILSAVLCRGRKPRLPIKLTQWKVEKGTANHKVCQPCAVAQVERRYVEVF